jgi:hypothetical protein
VASTSGLAGAPDAVRQPSVTTDVVYGHKDGLALTFDAHRPAQPHDAGVIAIVSGGWQSSMEMGRLIASYEWQAGSPPPASELNSWRRTVFERFRLPRRYGSRELGQRFRC